MSPRQKSVRKQRTDVHASNRRNWVCLAVIGTPKGVDGAVRITCYNETPAALASFNPLYVGDARRKVEISVIETPKPAQVVARITDITTREQARALTGMELFIPRTVMSDPEEGEFYIHDLIGLHASLPDGRDIGFVRTCQDYGAGSVLEISGGPDIPGFEVPFTREFVPVVDVDGGTVVIDPPVGLLDDD